MATINPIQLQKYLKGVDYPVSKKDLLARAEENGADGDVRAALSRLPEQTFEKPTDVSEAVGKLD